MCTKKSLCNHTLDFDFPGFQNLLFYSISPLFVESYNSRLSLNRNTSFSIFNIYTSGKFSFVYVKLTIKEKSVLFVEFFYKIIETFEKYLCLLLQN